ncbi:protein-export membrane protein SecF [Synechococcus sp. PCC 7335]|uniref:protein translocase subunit SecF n=1 Tax=Synechococcus sp. (strain ATCC 29403 / PCC 7335) TaxID=91464 RepID=UPI00017ECAC0|nr:protein translocase subunit SecF [Synechococcus sp. PCC 7335]EDX87448.1 protein-export membrane protein SecF [Synechococcus sp. PCC 7335]
MKLNVIKQKTLWWSISSILILVGIASMAFSWQQYGAPIKPSLDFVGGTRLQLSRDCTVANNCTDPIDISEVRQVLNSQDLTGSSIQLSGEDQQSIVVRTRNLDVDQRDRLQSALSDTIGTIDPALTKNDTVGPVLGKQLLTSGLLSLLVAFALIAAYLSLRFKFDYAILAIVALLHDILITLGLFSILSLVTGYEADSLFIVALLTIVGFSVNDTVVIYDRIRETLQRTPERSINQIVEEAVNSTLGRSINTTLTTVLTLLSIVIFGGDTLKFFALALITGFLAGAYSSIFVASTLLAWWRSRSEADSVDDDGFEEPVDTAPTSP